MAFASNKCMNNSLTKDIVSDYYASLLICYQDE